MYKASHMNILQDLSSCLPYRLVNITVLTTTTKTLQRIYSYVLHLVIKFDNNQHMRKN